MNAEGSGGNGKVLMCGAGCANVCGRAYLATKEAPAARRERDRLQWVGYGRDSVKLGLLLCISINWCMDASSDLGHISARCVMNHK